MKTIEVIVGQPNTVDILPTPTTRLEVIPGRFDPSMSELALPVVQTGQTRWNVGTSEARRILHLNGGRQIIGVDYAINLPFIDWLSPMVLDPTDQLILSF